MSKFLKTILFGIALFAITRVGTHLFIAKPQAQVGTGSAETLAAHSQPGQRTATPVPAARRNDDEFNQGVVTMMNQRYPKMGANGIRIDRVSYVNKLFMFHKTYTEHTVDMFDSNELRGSLPELIADLCGSTMVDMFKNGAIGIGNHVSDKNGVLIHFYHATKEDCEKNE